MRRPRLPEATSPLLALDHAAAGPVWFHRWFVARVARRRRRLLLVPIALLAAAVGMSGCAGPNTTKIYTVTVAGSATSGGVTITKSSYC